MILEKRIYKKIERYLYNQFEASEELEIKREDIIYGSKTKHLGEEIGASMCTSNSSKVESAVLQLVELENDENTVWVKVIQEVLDEFKGTEYETLIDLTYNKQYRVTKIIRLMNIEKSTYYERRSDVIMQVALHAATEGLIRNRVSA